MIILIDDDKLMHLSWHLRAKKAEKDFRSFFSLAEFFKTNLAPSKHLTIYIDSHLGEGARGEIEAKKLFDLGFKNLILTTGYLDLQIEQYAWLKGIISKHPPF